MSFNDVAIRVEGISKRFELYDSPRDQLKQFIFPKLQRMISIGPKQYFREFWALKDISFEVKKGESVGIVGMNGSGKSTLLQIITGTLSPTSGVVTTHGRIAALLELGSGFNPDFSGWENVYLNGALLGLSRKQINERLDAIATFADIGEHIDQPLRTYSSGMNLRLAFAVATAFHPGILIIDEALAVGDAYFQQKCFYKIGQFKKNGGTLLFVSHDANVVKNLCDKAILIDNGQVISEGLPKDVIDLYQGIVAKRTDMGDREITLAQNMESDITWKKATSVITNGEAELIEFKLCDKDGKEVVYLESEKELIVQYKVRLQKRFERPAFGLIIRDKLGCSIFETSTYAMRMEEKPIDGRRDVAVSFRFNFNLKAGQYSFSIGVANKGFSKSEFEEYSLLMHDVEQIQIIESRNSISYGGIFNMKPIVTVSVLG